MVVFPRGQVLASSRARRGYSSGQWMKGCRIRNTTELSWWCWIYLPCTHTETQTHTVFLSVGSILVPELYLHVYYIIIIIVQCRCSGTKAIRSKVPCRGTDRIDQGWYELVTRSTQVNNLPRAIDQQRPQDRHCKQ